MKFTDFVTIRKDLRKGNANDYFTICKRDNNPKRNFIIVQNYLGKHVPQHPSTIISYFNELAEAINKSSYGDFCLKENKQTDGIFYFAETALAIGEYLKNKLNINYQFYTTREEPNNYKNVLMDFTEDHCHAPLHLVIGNEKELRKCKRMLIIDDEITSGNTIMKVIDKLKIINPELKIYVASFVNLMSSERTLEFIMEGIEIISLISCNIINENKEINVKDSYQNSTDKNENSILVLGTEEEMYNALIYAKKLEDQGFNVFFHASTRSPIVPSNRDFYSLKTRLNFLSAKDKSRNVYLYNLKKYKQIFIFRNLKDGEMFFDKEANNLLKEYSELPIKFYDYGLNGGDVNE